VSETKGGGSADKGWFSSVRKSIEGEARKSISQIRGIPHPQSCAFLPDPPHTLAVVGWDGRGNGVLSLSDFSKEEATRIAYHVIAKASPTSTMPMRHGIPDPPATAEQCGKLYVGERVNVLEEGMKEITFQDNDGFVSVSTNKDDAAQNDEKEASETTTPEKSSEQAAENS
jgi:hypothetical protein